MADAYLTGTGATVYFAGRLAKDHREFIEKIGKKMMCEYFLMTVLFNAFNVSYSAGLQTKYGGLMPSLNLFLTGLFVLLIIGAAASLIHSTDQTNLSDFS